jgi:hypothetical protein
MELVNWSLYIVLAANTAPVLLHDNLRDRDACKAVMERVAQETFSTGTDASWKTYCVPRYVRRK